MADKLVAEVAKKSERFLDIFGEKKNIQTLMTERWYMKVERKNE